MILLREKRPDDAEPLSQLATMNVSVLHNIKSGSRSTIDIEIFGQDGGVVGGRRVISKLHQIEFRGLTDVIIDMSGLSLGIAFPVVRYFLEIIEFRGSDVNLHLISVNHPVVDGSIRSIRADNPCYVQGFVGRATLSESAEMPLLWVPQLSEGRRADLNAIRNYLNPASIYPVLPFPALDPRRGDNLTSAYVDELEGEWPVDSRSIVYADEADPLDSYRMTLRLDDARRKVFDGLGGSILVLSPLGNKVMAIGALMAALERDLPVAYMEAFGYVMTNMAEIPTTVELIHIWLEGEAYPKREPIRRSGSVT